jgi:catechol 2,3-dioxygenase-like lactoylglutathione lyase family enzyme
MPRAFFPHAACKAMALAAALTLSAASGADMGAGRITGLGGVFIKSKDPKALAAWYRDVLGMPIESWGGALLRYDAPGHPDVMTWNAFSEKTDYMAPSTREFMLDFAVDDLDAFLTKLAAKGVTPLKREDSAEGSFAWVMDPDGTKIELWQPKKKAP